LSYALEITELAEIEYIEIYHFYRNITAQLGNKFELETETIFEKIQNNPFLFQRKFKHYREAVYKKFPYVIIYEIIDKTVIVHSFFPAKRQPSKKLKN